MTTPERLMGAGMPFNQAIQISGNNVSGIVGTGGTKATAVQLLGGTNTIATVASAGVAAFQLQTAEASPPVVVEVDAGTSAVVYAAGTTESINALSAGAGFTVTNGKRAIFWPSKITTTTPPTNKWIAILSA
jgi:hypothetical protein